MQVEVKELRTKGSYKHWNKEQRKRSAALTTRAEKLGWIKPRIKCERCTQSEGILHTHNENYDVTLEVLTNVFSRKPIKITEEEKAKVNSVIEILCFRCHFKHHSQHRSPAAYARYWSDIAAGKIFAPVFKHVKTPMNRV